jgi:chromosome segregation ATPase
VEQYAKIAKGKEMLLHATRLALKLKECALAKLENREPNIGQSLLKLDYLHDFDMDDQTDSDLEFDELMVNEEQSAEKRSESDIRRLNKLLRKVWHPDRHPTVISLAMENYELRERLAKFESGEMTNESATQKNDLYTKELQKQIHELVKAKHEKRHETEEGSAQKHKYDEELSVDINTKLMKLEHENNELRELLIKLQKEQYDIQSLKQENTELKQLVEQLRNSQEEVLSVTEVEQMLNEIEGLKLERDELQVQYTSTANKLDNLLRDIELFKSQLQLLENANAELKEERDTLQSKLINQEEKLILEIEGLKQENTSLALQINRWKQQYEQEASNSITLTRSIEQLNIQLSEQKKEMRNIREKEEDWRQSILLKEHEINILTQQLAEATITLEDFRYKLDIENKRYKRLEKNMLECGSNPNQQHELVQQYEQEILNLKSKIEEKSLQIHQLHNTHQAELKAYEAIKQNANKEIEQLQVKLQQLEELSSEREAALQCDIEERLHQAESERDSLKVSLLKSERHVEMVELELKKIQHALKEQQELEKIAQDQKQMINAELQEKVQQLKHQETELRSQLHKLQLENNSLKDISEKLKIELSSKQNDNTGGQNESQIIEEINKFREERQGQIDLLSERCHSLEVQLASQADELYAKKQEIELERNSLLKTIQEQSAQLESLNMEVAELRNLNNKLERQNGELMGHRNPKQKIQQIVKIKQENNDLRNKVRQLEMEIDQFNKNQQNKENEYYADSLPLYNNSNALKLNVNRGSYIDTTSSQPLSLLGNTNNIESREVETLKKQLSTVENTVSNLVRMYSAKKRKFDSNLSPNASKTTSFKRVMSMLTDLENACSNNRGTRGSNTR